MFILLFAFGAISCLFARSCTTQLLSHIIQRIIFSFSCAHEVLFPIQEQGLDGMTSPDNLILGKPTFLSFLFYPMGRECCMRTLVYHDLKNVEGYRNKIWFCAQDEKETQVSKSHQANVVIKCISMLPAQAAKVT